MHMHMLRQFVYNVFVFYMVAGNTQFNYAAPQLKTN